MADEANEANKGIEREINENNRMFYILHFFTLS